LRQLDGSINILQLSHRSAMLLLLLLLLPAAANAYNIAGL
jgi:hypothetical protein